MRLRNRPIDSCLTAISFEVQLFLGHTSEVEHRILKHPDDPRFRSVHFFPSTIRLMQLTIAPESDAIAQARELIERVQQESPTSPLKTEIIDIITTIAVYKFANLSREEVEAMLGLKLEETRVYREAKAEGR
jgi:Protein of unknown function (DUF2887)